MKGKYANIVIDISHEKVDRPFQYRIPEPLQAVIEEGMGVSVPFGAGNRQRQGYVIEITDQAEYDTEKLKDITAIRTEDISVEAEFIRLAAWMKRQYGSTMITALKTVLPVRKKSKQLEKKVIRLCPERKEAEQVLKELERKHSTARARLLRELILEQELPQELITGKLNVSVKTIQDMEKLGLVEVIRTRQYRNPIRRLETESTKQRLSETQQHIVDEITADLVREQPGVHLIQGITGSGKTEVYMEIIEQVIAEGRQAIVLIPEIALTYQTALRFYRRFGERVSVMNSRLSQGERFDQFERAKKGEIDVIIGPRSALFTPFTRLGVIVIDEEHENSYKSETMPKYHARETAIQRARMKSAGVVLGSATPSLESYYRAKTGGYQLYHMTQRLTGGTLPQVYTVDLREELKAGNRSVFSGKLQELIAERLQKQEQIMLFLNRRGYAGFISCRSCGYVVKCPHCDVSLSEHRNGRMVCHYCGYEEGKKTLCPQCGSKYLLGFKAGTEQIEEQIGRMYPKARVLRMDADTTKGKEDYEKILSAFANHEADILVGTQMIVKGHDFPAVTLVGILAADLSLAVNDYRAAERTFQLLTQAAGRAGRGERPGEVVIQTYQPKHYAVVAAAEQDYESFYEQEIAYRQLLDYPPAAHMMAVQIFARTKEGAQNLAETLAGLVRQEKLMVIGPAPAAIGRISDIFRYVLYVKDSDYERLVAGKDCLEQYLNTQENRQESVQFDFDPMHAF